MPLIFHCVKNCQLRILYSTEALPRNGRDEDIATEGKKNLPSEHLVYEKEFRSFLNRKEIMKGS